MTAKKKILTVCHDAGGAEVVSAYVKKHLNQYSFSCLAQGPALKVFTRKKLNSLLIKTKKTPADLLKELKEISLVLTSTSWASSIELDFIRQAKRLGIKTAVYLDHWVNYRERFGYPQKNWQRSLPDEIWLGDRHAFLKAKECFSAFPVRLKLVPNLYFAEVKQQYQKIEKQMAKQSSSASGPVLFVSEPILECSRVSNRPAPSFTEFDVFDKLLSFLSQSRRKHQVSVLYHPAEKRDKYDNLLSRYSKSLEISKAAEEHFLEAIARSSIVVGIHSMALVLSHLCGKTTVSFIPDKNIKCPLPFKGIIKINKLADLFLNYEMRNTANKFL